MTDPVEAVARAIANARGGYTAKHYHSGLLSAMADGIRAEAQAAIAAYEKCKKPPEESE